MKSKKWKNIKHNIEKNMPDEQKQKYKEARKDKYYNINDEQK